MIQYGKHLIDKKDIKSVVKVLNSKNLTQGPLVKKFEKKFADYVGANYAVSASNCSNSLISACIALGLKNNDIVWSTANTFVASTNCAIHCGAKVDFIDIDPKTNNMSLIDLKEKLKNTKKNRLPKILISVHFAGLINNQKEIWKLAKKYGFSVIEDCCHALGASRDNEKAGSCKYSDISVFSFHPVKAMTTGEGGMATTNKKDLNDKMVLINNHGINRNKKKFKYKNNFDLYYEQSLLGYNFRLTDIQSALGLSQLKKLRSFILTRNKLAKRYDEAFKKISIQIPKSEKKNIHAYHLYVIKLNSINQRNGLYKFLLKNKIKCNLHYVPIYKHPFYEKITKKKIILSETEKYYQTSLSIPLYVSLGIKTQDKIISLIRKYIN